MCAIGELRREGRDPFIDYKQNTTVRILRRFSAGEAEDLSDEVLLTVEFVLFRLSRAYFATPLTTALYGP